MTESDKPAPVARAEAWLDDQTEPAGNRPKGLEDTVGAPTAGELRRQQQREMRGAILGTEGQTHGALFGALGGAVVGAVIGVLLGLALFEASSAARVVIPIVATVAGAVIGFVYWGGRTPELENETMTATGEPGGSSTPRDPGTDHRGR